MYIRTIHRKNKDGSVTSYVQLAHNYHDPKTGQPRAKVLYTFGREDQLDLDAVRRLADTTAYAALSAMSSQPSRRVVSNLRLRTAMIYSAISFYTVEYSDTILSYCELL